jgi:hypothetical protein
VRRAKRAYPHVAKLYRKFGLLNYEARKQMLGASAADLISRALSNMYRHRMLFSQHLKRRDMIGVLVCYKYRADIFYILAYFIKRPTKSSGALSCIYQQGNIAYSDKGGITARA